MPHEIKPINRVRVENTSGIDKIVSLSIDYDNQHLITKPWDVDKQIDLQRPYFLHNIKEGITYKFGKVETTKTELSDIFKSQEVRNNENFQKTAYIEFLKENDEDISTLTRVREFLKNANTLLNKFEVEISGEKYAIKVSGITWPASYMDPSLNLYSRYLMFRTEKDSKYIIIPNIHK